MANTQAVRQIIEGKIFYLRQFFLTLQDRQNCKKDSVSSCKLFVEKLYDAKIHLNLSGKICASWPLLLISVSCDRASVELSGVFSKESQHSKRKTAGNTPSTTTPAFLPTSPPTFFATSPNVDHTSDTPHKNKKSADSHDSGDDISSGKADLSSPRIRPKTAFVEEVDDDTSDFELVSRRRKRGASKLITGDKQT